MKKLQRIFVVKVASGVIRPVFFLAVVLGSIPHGFAQGFINLNFESAHVPDLAPGVFALVPITSGLPDWTGAPFAGGINILHNDVSGGGAIIGIEGPQFFSSQILQGNYMAYVTGSGFGTPASAYIAQTGEIPVGAQSLTFYSLPWEFTTADFQVTFGGSPLPVVKLGTGPNYNIMGCDVSGIAGFIAELRFTAPPNTGGFLDNIQFSPTPVPEPGTWALLLSGAVLFGLNRWRKVIMYKNG